MIWARYVPTEPWRRNQYAVLVAVFISFLGFSFVIPFLPLYIRQLGVEDVGQAAFLSGIAFAVAPFFSGLLAPVWGAYADRHGVKIMVQRALISFAILNLLSSFVVAPWQLIAVRTGIGLFGGFGPMTASLVTIGAPKEEIGSAIGKLQATQILATAIGPTIGGVVADQFGIRTSFIITAVLCAASFLLISALYREEKAERARATGRARMPMRGLIAIAGFLPLCAILLMSQFVDRGVSPLLPLFIAQIAPEVPAASTSGFVLTAGSLVSAFAATQVGRLSRRFDARVLLPVSLLIGAVATVPLALVDEIWQLVGLRVLFGLAAGTTATITYAAASAVVPAESRSTAFGFLGSTTSFATALGPVVAGSLATISLRVALGATAAVYVAVFFLGLIVSRRHAGTSHDEAPAR